jgi:urease accessory protein
LLRLGQKACQSLLSAAPSHSPPLIETALGVPFDEIGSYNPWWDIAASRHEYANFRLFIS